jgi:hypothetical protein
MISGHIYLIYEDQQINVRKYVGKPKRNEIINSWKSLYGYRPFEVVIVPDIDYSEDVKGVIQLHDINGSLIDEQRYFNYDERDDLIKECKKNYKKFSITIKPKV